MPCHFSFLLTQTRACITNINAFVSEHSFCLGLSSNNNLCCHAFAFHLKHSFLFCTHPNHVVKRQIHENVGLRFMNEVEYINLNRKFLIHNLARLEAWVARF